MSSQNEHNENRVTGSTTPAGTGKSNATPSSRLQQMFPVLSANEIDRTAVALRGTHAGYMFP